MKRQFQFIKIASFVLALGAAISVQAVSTSFVTINSGWFLMGDSNDGNSIAMPHQVYVSTFQMETNLVNSVLWQEVYQYATITNPIYNFVSAHITNFGLKNPEQTLTWYDAVAWCNARSQMEGLTPCYYTNGTSGLYTGGAFTLGTNNVAWSSGGYRLPTEAEWEKAARGGLTTNRFPWGMTINHNQACYNSPMVLPEAYDLGPANSAPVSTVQVGTFPPNGFGLYDMAGNVDEWCWDVYSATYYSSTANTNNPQGPASGSGRIIRGGHWSGYAVTCRTGARNSDGPASTYNTLGFRCVRIASAGLLTPTISVNVGSYVYDGSAEGPNASNVNTGGSTGAITMLYVGISGTLYGPSAVLPTGAGSYTVVATVAADSNYNLASSSPTAFSIARATPTVTVSVGSYTYSGSPQGPNSSAVNTGGSTGLITLSYAGVSGTIYGPSVIEPTAVGSYTATATVSADSNYNQASSPATQFTIAAAVGGGTGIVDFQSLTNLMGTNKISLQDLESVLNNYTHTGTVNLAALTNFIGSDSVSQADLNVVLAHYWASSPPYVANLVGGTTNFVFAVSNFTFAVQVNNNLANPNGWQPIGQAVFQFTDTNAIANQSGFYRIITQTNSP